MPSSSSSACAGAVMMTSAASGAVALAGCRSGGGCGRPDDRGAIDWPGATNAPASTRCVMYPSASATSSSAALDVSRVATGSPEWTGLPSSTAHSTRMYSVSLLLSFGTRMSLTQRLQDLPADGRGLRQHLAFEVGGGGDDAVERVDECHRPPQPAPQPGVQPVCHLGPPGAAAGALLHHEHDLGAGPLDRGRLDRDRVDPGRDHQHAAISSSTSSERIAASARCAMPPG